VAALSWRREGRALALLVGGFLLALLTWQNTRLKQLTRGVIFLPWVIGLGTSSLLWVWLFDQRVAALLMVLVPTMAIAMLAGERLHRHLSQGRFERVVALVLIASGIALLFK